MKPPLPAVLYGTGLISAFAAGWFLKSTAHPEITLALAAHPAQPPGVRTPPKSAHPLAASGASWLDAASADLAAVRAAVQPGVVNQVLLEKLKAILELPDENQRTPRWQSLITAMRPEDAEAMQELFYSLHKEGRWFDPEFLAFAIQWGRVDGAHAVLMGSDQQSDIYGVMVGWAQEDAAGATAWLMNPQNFAVYLPSAASGLFQGIAAVDPGAAEALVIANAGNPRFESILYSLAQMKISQMGLAGAETWFDQLAQKPVPDALKLKSFETLQEARWRQHKLGLLDTPAGASLPERHMAAPWLPESAGEILGWDCSQENPEAGIVKIDRITSSKAQKSATESLLSGWADNDFGSLSLWLKGNREHPIFDQAAYHLVRKIQGMEPVAAKEWAHQIKDADLRERATELDPLDPFSTGE